MYLLLLRSWAKVVVWTTVPSENLYVEAITLDVIT